MKMYPKNKKQPSTRPGLIGLAIAVCIAAVSMYFIYAHNNEAGSTKSESSVNYSPPTEEEKQSADNVKNDIAQNTPDDKNDEQQTSTPTFSQSTNVIVVDASQYGDMVEVRSFTQGVYDNGLCIIRFTKGNLSVEKQAPAYSDASTTICTNPEIKRSEFPVPGIWQVIVTFSAPEVSGASNPQNITIE